MNSKLTLKYIKDFMSVNTYPVGASTFEIWRRGKFMLYEGCVFERCAYVRLPSFPKDESPPT